MIVLVLNCGSSSLKYQLISLEDGERKMMCRGLVERLGIMGGHLKQSVPQREAFTVDVDVPDHTAAIKLVLETLIGEKVLHSLSQIEAVGHRVVHGGELFTQSVVIDEEVKDNIRVCSDLAPLHNPSNLKGILSMEILLPGIPQIAVFDTSFHQTMPREAFLYGLPYKFYEEDRIRRYGFHGISHGYVGLKACEITGIDYHHSKIITCHLGNGASLTAIKDGVSVDTSMGFTPLTGLMMGTRCGTLDPGILLYLEEKHKLSISGISNLLNKESGLQGISGLSSDMRDIIKAAGEGVERARLALEMYVYRVRKWIGSFVGIMDGVDMIVFTGGVGENSYYIRQLVCERLKFFGVEVDKHKNVEACGQESVFSSIQSEVKLVVVPTNEELVIAMETFRLLNQ
jgi:acetate kinase